MKDEKVVCRTPTAGKKSTRIDRWKFDLVREAILKSIPRDGNGVSWKELPGRVKKVLPPDRLKEFGSVGWNTVTVKLEMEVRGEIERLHAVSPQLLVRRD